VPALEAVVLPPGATRLDAWSATQGLDARLVRRLNPAFANGRVARGDRAMRVLVPASVEPRQGSEPGDVAAIAPGAAAAAALPAPAALAAAAPSSTEGAATALQRRSHTVARGDSAWKIARRYGIPIADLLARNGLDARALLRPGMVLEIDADPGR
jgi:membrane-bound lytic murein transglycosylase D